MRRTRVTFSDHQMHVVLAAVAWAREYGFEDTVTGRDLLSLDRATAAMRDKWGPVAHHNLMRLMGVDDAVVIQPDAYKEDGKYATEG
jgi:hypothetical protein